ncbi:MAG TPA: HD domain-containing phosphohydrolase [Rectinemataceae bacterium]|nr:HD domain-containing phosphohydrolase [Rectinemataceae bacterium]
MKIGIRAKTIFVIFPVVLASLGFVGASSLFSARTGMVRLAMASLSFKAEVLQQYMDSQWKLLVNQGFATDPEFKKAVMLSAGDYARSLLRNRTEWICAVDLDGNLVSSASRGSGETGVPDALLSAMKEGRTGPVVFGEGRRSRYGQAFFFAPLSWYVMVSDTASAIFAETNQMTTTILTGFGVTAMLSLLLLFFITGAIVGPLTRVTEGMKEIVRSNNFEARITVTSDDEVGDLTRHFNALCGELDRSYSRIHDIALREVEARYQLLERELEAIVALGKVAEFRDEDTATHIVRVGLYAKILAGIFYETEEDKRSLYYAAPLHDLGKIGVPDLILLKPAALDSGELAIMRTHTTIGYEILKEFRNPALIMGGSIALTHHERFDGKGYPRGLKGKDIPLCGRILAIVDVFDALTSKRPYKKAWPVEEAFDYVVRERGGHFDPEIATAFLDSREEVLGIMKSVAD